MIIRIARKEMTEMFRDGRFRWATLILFFFLSASTLAGLLQYAKLHARQSTAQQQERQRWLNKGQMSTHMAGYIGLYAYKPYLPTYAADHAIAPFVGTYTHLWADEQDLLQDKPAEDEAPTRWVSQLSAALCLQMLVPLLIVILGFASFAGEREQGTLRQLLSLGIRRRDLILGKALGVAVPLLIVLAPVSLLGSAAILLNSAGVPLTDIALRLTVMALGYFCYFFIFLGLTLSLSMLVSTARQALLLLLVFWFINCLMAAPVVTELAGKLYPLPTSFEVAAEIDREMSRKTHFTIRTKEIEQELMAKYKVASVKDLPVNPGGLQELEEQKINNEIYSRAFNRVYETYRRQDRLYQLSGLVAPLLAVQSLSMGLAGTDTPAHVHYDQAARDYRDVMLTILNEDHAYHTPPEGSKEEALRGRELWEKVPPFTYSSPQIGWVLGHYVASCAVLLVWLLITLLITRKAFARTFV